MHARRFGVTISPLLVILASALASSPARGQGESALLNRPAPDFTLPMLSGGKGSLSELKGKVVVLNFFASW